MVRTFVALILLLSTAHLLRPQDIRTDVSSASFDSLLTTLFPSHQPGAAVLVSRGGSVLFRKSYGMADVERGIPMRPDHMFQVASITKQFTAVAILQLTEEGKLRLNDPVTRFLPEYPMQGNVITVEHLLAHTSGIWNFTRNTDPARKLPPEVTPQQLIDFFKDEPLRFVPGSAWEYSNSGYALLGAIIETVSGMSCAEYFAERVFTPLGMNDSFFGNRISSAAERAAGYTQRENGFVVAEPVNLTHPYAAGAIQSTVDDLFAWNRGVWGGILIRMETLQRAVTRYVLADGSKTDYGYGWRLGYVQDSPSVWHGGMINGFIGVTLYLPEEEVFVAVLTNCDAYAPEDVAPRLAGLAIGRPYAYTAVRIPASLLSEYTGVYTNDKGRRRVISQSGDTLFAQLGRGPRSIVFGYQKDRFVFDRDIFRSMEFTRDERGKIRAVVETSREAKEQWIRTNQAIPSDDGIALSDDVLSRYVGEYAISPEARFTVTKDGGRLYVRARGQDRLEMFAESETAFFLKVTDAQFSFVVTEDGAVTGMIMSQGRRRANAKRIGPSGN